MSRKLFGADKFAEDMAALEQARVLAALGQSKYVDKLRYDSPLEELFYWAFVLYGASHANNHQVDRVIRGDIQAACDKADKSDTLVCIERQIPIHRHKVDFLISVLIMAGASTKKIVVEIDGHDFHERTKEQASRDRSFDRKAQASGMTVMRFTGSELYRDPMKCVQEVFDRCGQIAYGGDR